jgi:hypothetical protein
MNEILYDAWETPAPPTDEARARARTALLERAAAQPRRAPTRRRRVLVPAALVAGLALVAVVGLSFDGSRPQPGVPPATAAVVLERAAHAAQTESFTPPRPDQWVYTEDRIEGGGGRTQWRRADGGGFAIRDEDGRLHVEQMRPRKVPGRPLPGPLENYAALAELPTDPVQLRKWAYDQTDSIEGAGSTPDAEVYSILRGLLGGGAVPPALKAAIFRALKDVPGVTLRTVEVLGHRVLALQLTDEWLRQELLLDPQTYAYYGGRSTAVGDPPKQKGGTRGQVVVAVRVSEGIVDEPGQRP